LLGKLRLLLDRIEKTDDLIDAIMQAVRADRGEYKAVSQMFSIDGMHQAPELQECLRLSIS
jgi:hypothetical protein